MSVRARTTDDTATPAPSRRAAGASQGESIVATLGARVRAMRRGAGLTLDQLAGRSGVSRAMLSKVERGEKSPTLAIVARIARGLDVSLSALLGAEPDRDDVVVVKAVDRLSFVDPQTGLERQVLSPAGLNDGVELVLHRLPPGASSGTLLPYALPAAKYILVHEGRLTVHIEDRTLRLEAGDTLYFEVKAPYQFVNESAAPCAYYMVIVRRA